MGPGTNFTILSSSYNPEVSGIALYSTDLATFLTSQGFAVSVITASPRNKIDGSTDEEKSNANIFRIKNRKLRKISIIQSILKEINFLLRLNRNIRAFDFNNDSIIISIVPSIAFGLLGARLAKQNDLVHISVFQDISHLGAQQINSKLGKLVAFPIRLLEKYIVKNSDQVITISPEMSNEIILLGGERSSVSLIYNYTLEKTASKSIFDFRKKYDISESSFVVMHTGNIGRKQDLKNVVRAAEILKHNQQIFFVLIGDGNQKPIISRMSANLTNLILLPFVSEDEYLQTITSADILLVNELPTQLGMSLPSKLTSYLPTGKLILASVPSDGPTANFLVNKAVIIPPDNPQQLANAILSFLENPDSHLEKMIASKIFALKYLNPNDARKKYLEVIEESYYNSKRKY